MIKPPPLDKSGMVIPHDHSDINNDDEVIRRISEEYHVIFDHKRNLKRISTKAYPPSSGDNGGMSVDLKTEIEKDRIDARKYVTSPKWMGSVIFKVAPLRNLKFQVGYDPITTGPDRNPYHGQVWGNFSKSNKTKLLNLAEWFVPIPGVSVR